MKNWKIHGLVLIIIIIAEAIGTKQFKIGPGTIVLLPMLFALLMGVLLAPKFFKVVNEKDMNDATPFITITLTILMARYGTLVGPNLPKVISSGPALLLQEFGNLGTILLGVPIAVWLGLKREAIGAAHSVAREPNVALIDEVYGIEGPEGRGVMGVYICGTVFGTIFFGLMATLVASANLLHPYSLAMAAGVGSGSMMTATIASLSAMFPSQANMIQAYGATSNMLTGLTGLYMSVWVALPVTEWLYKRSYTIKYGIAPAAKEVDQ